VKKGVDFFHNLNFVFKNGLDQVFKGAEIVAPSYGVQFKRSTEIKNRALKLLHLSNNVSALIIVIKRADIFINRIITNENAEV